MKSVGLRSVSAWVLATCIVAACGGKVDGVSDSSADGGDSDHGRDASTTTGDHSRDSGVRDAATKGDASVCIDVDVTGYDTSCAVDDDCIDVSAGTFCSGNGGALCMCGGSAVSASEQSRYEDQISALVGSGTNVCSCPYFGRARCIESACVFCPSSIGPGPAPAGCPDGG